MKWLYEHWMKATPFLVIYTFLLVFLYLRDANYALYLIWLQCIVYWLHQFEEYVYPGNFLKFICPTVLDIDTDNCFMVKVAFWVNVGLTFVAMPLCAVIAHFYGLKFSLWAAYFSMINGIGHVVLFFKCKFKYNPGFLVSLFLNIPIGIYAVCYIMSNHLVSNAANVISLSIGVVGHILLLICGFCYIKPKLMKVKGDKLCNM